jgi:hypothetical protein
MDEAGRPGVASTMTNTPADKPAARQRPIRCNRRPVYDAEGRLFASCTDAAAAHNTGVPTIWTKARLQRSGFRFADEPSRKPAAPSAPSEG